MRLVFTWSTSAGSGWCSNILPVTTAAAIDKLFFCLPNQFNLFLSFVVLPSGSTTSPLSFWMMSPSPPSILFVEIVPFDPSGKIYSFGGLWVSGVGLGGSGTGGGSCVTLLSSPVDESLDFFVHSDTLESSPS